MCRKVGCRLFLNKKNDILYDLIHWYDVLRINLKKYQKIVVANRRYYTHQLKRNATLKRAWKNGSKSRRLNDRQIGEEIYTFDACSQFFENINAVLKTYDNKFIDSCSI